MNDLYYTELVKPFMNQQVFSAVVFWSSVFVWAFLIRRTIREILDVHEMKEAAKGDDGKLQHTESFGVHRLAFAFWSGVLFFALITTHIITGTPVFDSNWIYLPSGAAFGAALYEVKVSEVVKTYIENKKPK